MMNVLKIILTGGVDGNVATESETTKGGQSADSLVVSRRCSDQKPEYAGNETSEIE